MVISETKAEASQFTNTTTMAAMANPWICSHPKTSSTPYKQHGLAPPLLLRKTQLLACAYHRILPALSPPPPPAAADGIAPSAIVDVANVSPSDSGDYSVFFLMGALLFSVYWVANFVVPEVISRGLGSSAEEQDPKEG